MYRLSLILCASLYLVGCQSVEKITDTAKHVSFNLPSDKGADAFKKALKSRDDAVPNLNSQFEYKRFTINGKVAWLAHGMRDQFPYQNTDVYYSADRNVFKWANGRLKSINNGQMQWREGEVTLINWRDFNRFHQVRFMREVERVDDRYAVQQKRIIRVVDEPQHHAYIGDTSQLLWLREYNDQQLNAGNHKMPKDDIWYALAKHDLSRPIYAQQCISTKQCITWQDWKVVP